MPLFTGAHLQSIASHFWPRRLDLSRFPVEACVYATEPGVKVLAEVQRPAGVPRGQILLLHGLESSSRAGYMLTMAQAALEAGYAVERLNLRSCGGTEAFSSTFYNAGLTSDLRAVLGELQKQGRTPVDLVGYSLGGNVCLKLAGELGDGAPPLIASVCAVSTPIDLAACVRKMCDRGNFIYHRRFVRKLIARTRRRHALAPDCVRAEGLDRIKTIVEFDDVVTAPAFGFRDAAHYYACQSSIRYLPAIRIPTLLIQAKDDPLIPFRVFEDGAVRGNPHIRVLATEHGGHVGFISRRRPRFWLDGAVLEWIASRQKKLAPN